MEVPNSCAGLPGFAHTISVSDLIHFKLSKISDRGGGSGLPDLCRSTAKGVQQLEGQAVAEDGPEFLRE